MSPSIRSLRDRFSVILILLTLLIPQVHALDLETAIRQALDGAPVLKASEAGIESGERLLEQAARWRNPSLAMEAENVGGSGSFDGTDAAEYTIVLEQPIELGGKRKARRNLAEADLEESRLQAVIAREQLEAEARRRFIHCLQARERLKLAIDLEGAARSAAEAVEVQKGIGAAAGLDDRRTRVSLALARIEVEGANRDYRDARELLASLWNGGADFEVVGELRVPESLPEDVFFENLLHRSARRQIAEIPSERQRGLLQLEQSAGWPDLTVGLGHRWFEEDDAQAWVAGLTVSLPIFDRNRGRMQAASAQVRQANAEVEGQLRVLRESLQRTLSSLRRAHETATRLREEALPLARETSALVAEGYGLGRYELLYVLEAQKTLSEVERHWIDVLAQFHLAVSDLQSLVGEVPPVLEF